MLFPFTSYFFLSSIPNPGIFPPYAVRWSPCYLGLYFVIQNTESYRLERSPLSSPSSDPWLLAGSDDKSRLATANNPPKVTHHLPVEIKGKAFPFLNIFILRHFLLTMNKSLFFIPCCVLSSRKETFGL